MKLDIRELLPFFGLSLESPELRSRLDALGLDTSLSLPKLRKLGSQHISEEGRGIVLMFSERQMFESLYGTPASTGEAIFEAISIYPSGFKSFAAFSGSIGFSLEGVVDRAQLHRHLGSGNIKDEADGIVYEEAWRIEGINLFAKYSDTGQITSLQFNLPMR